MARARVSGGDGECEFTQLKQKRTKPNNILAHESGPLSVHIVQRVDGGAKNKNK